jgi:hypothetical protein
MSMAENTPSASRIRQNFLHLSTKTLVTKYTEAAFAELKSAVRYLTQRFFIPCDAVLTKCVGSSARNVARSGFSADAAELVRWE